MKLFSYWQSTTSYRVRAALNLKGIAYDTVPVDLSAGEQNFEEYLAINPGAAVPALVMEDGRILTQSIAIIEYLDSLVADPQLIPSGALERARTMAVAQTVVQDIHPVNNLRVANRLKSQFGATEKDLKGWMQHWMTQGFRTIEKLVQHHSPFAFGDAPDLSDICIVAQSFNASRHGMSLDQFPNIARITSNALKVPAIAAANPFNQPDAKVTV